MLCRGSPAFQAGKILGSRPERCSGSAMQKPMVVSGQGTVLAPPALQAGAAGAEAPSHED